MSRTQGREVAFKVIFETEFQDIPSEEALGAFEELHGNLPRRAREFSLALIEGTRARREEIDTRITATAQHWRLDRMGRVERTVLRLGTFELLHQPETPPAVAIDEAVELAKKYAGEEAGAFVNGVLDAVLPKKGVAQPPGGEEPVRA